MTKVLALTIPERETIIRALDDAPPGLEELRAVLLREHLAYGTVSCNGLTVFLGDNSSVADSTEHL